MFIILIIGFILFLLILGIIISTINKHSFSLSPMDKKHSLAWLPDLVNVGGTIVGIVMTAVGGVMFLNTTLKVYVFGFETNTYFNAEEQCRNDKLYAPRPTSSNEVSIEKQPTVEINEEEISQCVERKANIEKENYRRRQYEQMIDGFAFLFVGIFLWIMHRRKRKN